MDGAKGDKKPVRLTIYNQTYTLLIAGDPADLMAAANEVDELMTTIARSGNMDSARIAILACLHLQDRVHLLETKLEEFRSNVHDRTRQLSDLLDQVVSEPDAT